MYYQYFGLHCEPFSISPDPAFLFPSPQHAEALAHLQYGLQREGGFILLTGEVGTGKTTLCRALLQNMPAGFRVAYIINARLDSRDLLASICRELGLDPGGDSSVRHLVELLNDYLLQVHARGERTLLVVEEAQNLAPDVLETLRLLTNLETDKAKLLHILLVGQPELLDLIHRRELRQLNQRVVARSHLGPLRLAELRRYLAHRLRTAGATRDLFSGRAIASLYRHSGGYPRLVNLIADRALLGAYSAGRDSVNTALVRRASDEVKGTAVRRERDRAAGRWALALVLLVTLPVLGVLAYRYLPGWFAASNPVAVESAVSAGAPAVAQAPAALPSPAPPRADIRRDLLALWGLGQGGAAAVGAPLPRPQLCDHAVQAGLACYQATGLDLERLRHLNRPALASLAAAEGIEEVLVKAVGPGWVTIADGATTRDLPLTEFGQRWQGDLLLLWRPPPGYQGDLVVGAKNPRQVAWLQEALQQLLPEAELLITGGRYSEALAAQVREFQRLQGLAGNGVVDTATIIRMDDLLTDNPRLGGS